MMKSTLIIPIFGLLLINYACGETTEKKQPHDAPTHSRQINSKAKPSLSIYLTDGPIDPRVTAYGKGDWSRVRLVETPIISDADILCYDFKSHLMTLIPEALQRLPRPNASGIPFVVVANGERIYLGVFMSLISSMSRAVPSIVIDEHHLDATLPPNTLRISRVYAAPYDKDDPDSRSDKRIKEALCAMKKLK